MSIFSKIKDAIFGHHSATEQTSQQTAPQQQQSAGTQQQSAPAAPAAAPVDVGQVLANIEAEKGNPNLNYKTSIVDLMKLLDLDPSLQNREQLATELGYTGAKDGSAEMNIWLHKQVMQQLAANGGKVPADMMH